jgi:hypothetical protein
MAKDFLHKANKSQSPGVPHAIIDSISVLARCQYALVAQYGQVLGDVALRGADIFDYVLHAHFIIAEGAQNLQP